MTKSRPNTFVLPAVFSRCPYPLRRSIHQDEASSQSEQWFTEHTCLSPVRTKEFLGVKAGMLSAIAYPDADANHLRICADFLNCLFNIDDLVEEFSLDDAHGLATCCMGALRDPFTFETNKKIGIMTKSFFGRFTRLAGPRCRARFIHNMELYFRSAVQHTEYRAQEITPSIESYIAMRRDNSGCLPCFQFIEFAAGIDLLDEVAQNPIIKALDESVNDLIAWSNDIFSFDVEQDRGDTYNLVTVAMQEKGYSLQEAVDFVGDLCEKSIKRFESNRHRLPSWGPEIDADVAVYVDGLQNWIVAALCWSFDSERYFGKLGPEIKKHRIVTLHRNPL